MSNVPQSNTSGCKNLRTVRFAPLDTTSSCTLSNSLGCEMFLLNRVSLQGLASSRSHPENHAPWLPGVQSLGGRRKRSLNMLSSMMGTSPAAVQKHILGSFNKGWLVPRKAREGSRHGIVSIIASHAGEETEKVLEETMWTWKL